MRHLQPKRKFYIYLLPICSNDQIEYQPVSTPFFPSLWLVPRIYGGPFLVQILIEHNLSLEALTERPFEHPKSEAGLIVPKVLRPLRNSVLLKKSAIYEIP